MPQLPVRLISELMEGFNTPHFSCRQVTLPVDFDASFTSSLWFRGDADGDGTNHTVYVEVKRANACFLTVPIARLAARHRKTF